MDKRHVIIASDTVPQSRQLLLYSDDLDRLWQGVADVPEFVVGGVVGYEQSLFVASSGPADDPSAANRGLDDRNEGSELALEDAVEVVRASGCDKAISVG